MYNKELALLQHIMDIKDYRRFKMQLYAIDTGKYITKCIGYFLKNTLQLEFDSFTVITYNKNFNEETGILTITSEDFNQKIFLAEISIKNYNCEELESVDIPRLCIMPTMEFDLGNTSKPMKIKAEAIMLAQPCDEIFFNVNTD